MSNPRQPDDVLRMRGTFRRGRHGAPKTASPWPTGRPPRPRWLSREARAVWDDITPKLVEAGIVGPLDRSVLAAFCSMFAMWRRAAEAARAAEDPDERRVHERIVHQFYGDMMKGAAELGLTPRARRNIRPLDPPTVVDDGDGDGDGILDLVS